MTRNERRTSKKHCDKRDQILLAMDVAAIEKMAGLRFHAAQSEITGKWMSAEEVGLMTMHQMRVETASLPESDRKVSESWLRERGLLRLYNLPWSGAN